MEALRRLQGKCGISPGVAALAFFCLVIVVAGLCATAVLRRKRRRSEEQNVGEAGRTGVREEKFLGERNSGTCGAVKKALIGSVRWSRGSKYWEESGETEGQALREIALLELPVETVGRRGSPLSPVWQRRILMGERCELPRFSGLILYDERGRPLGSSGNAALQGKAEPVVTTLRDLL
ncbi:hypothetical protein H6P81_013710 [Aristolochia fimbriata]|uniref:Uncharacterized protein n=1 Tax=Aristolochia fimbriata TaxID=158543 RepID=A0AAV7EJ23_ARIFI|nr:hypothetical protein H6P81_013710 [Aristolochia fimbriata]